MLSCFFDQYQKVLVYSVDYLFTAHTYNVVCSYIYLYIFHSRMSIHLFWFISSFVCFLRPLLGGGRKRSPSVYSYTGIYTIHVWYMYPVLMFYLFLCLSRYGRRIHVSPFIKFVSQEIPFGTVLAHKNGPGGLPMRASRPWQRFGLSKRGLLIQVDRNLLWRNPGISDEMGICAYWHTTYIQWGRKFATVSSHAGY